MSYLDTTLFEQLEQSTLLTPNRRLSATLHKLYVDYQISLGRTHWETPDILPLASWLQRLWQAYLTQHVDDAPLLLTTSQEQFLWEAILTASKDKIELLQITETAHLIKSAWRSLQEWQVDLHDKLFNTADDYQALQAWGLEFKKRCQQNHWIDHASLINHLRISIEQGQIALPKQLVLVGFTEVSPQYHALFSSCEQQGVNLRKTHLEKPSLSCKQTALPQAEDEIIAMAKWAKMHWQQNKRAAIGCVIPSLDKIRDRVQQLFSAVFAEEHTFAVDPAYSPFNISAGKSLSRYPIIQTALLLLNVYKNGMSLEKFCYLLASPFIGEAESERIKRYTLDSLLRADNVTHIQLQESLQKTADNKQASIANQCPQLAARLTHFFQETAALNTTKSYREWSHIFNHLLSVLGWPGERSLTSYEYQIVDHWLNLLHDYASLDQVASPLHFVPALNTLATMASQAVFQPKTPEAPIQVLGMLEAAGLPFDYLWVSGLDDMSWPPQPKPNPFIPKRLQRELKMPHATAERELFFCQSMTQQFKQSTSHLVFSHAEKNDDLELQVSPLIRELPYIAAQQLELAAYLPISERLFQTRQTERMVDEQAPALSPNEKIRGGVNVIKLQALCPFRSFAESRLHAKELESPLPGLRAKDRGNLIHRILELIWNQLQHQDNLINLDQTELQTLATQCIDQTFAAFPNSRSHHVQYIRLEKKRLQKLILDWLEVEKARPAFSVLMSEKAVSIQLAALTLSLRIDRIDQLENGKKLIVDYKTGKHNDIHAWFGENPEEPQLPLYALLDQTGTAAISFAQVVSGESCFKGVSQDDIEIKGIKPLDEVKKNVASSWPEQLSTWHTTFTKLAHDFSQGSAQVLPKEPAQTCTYCHLKPFCRINEDMHHESH